MDYSAFIHRQRDRFRGTVMDGFPLLFLYRIPPDLPEHCNGCGTKFYICHTLDCKKGGLVTVHHNELRDGFVDLASKYFNPKHILDDPKIYTGCAMRGEKDTLKEYPSNNEGDLNGYLLIRDHWNHGT